MPDSKLHFGQSLTYLVSCKKSSRAERRISPLSEREDFRRTDVNQRRDSLREPQHKLCRKRLRMTVMCGPFAGVLTRKPDGY